MNRWRQLSHSRVIQGIAFGCVIAMIALSPGLNDYLANQYQVSVQDLVLPIIQNLLVALIVAAMFYRQFTRHRLRAIVSAAMATALFTTSYDSRLNNIYPLFHALIPVVLPGDSEGVVFSLIFIGLILGLSYVLGRLLGFIIERRRWPQRDLAVAFGLTVTATFLFLAVPSIKSLAQAWPQFFYHPQSLGTPAAASKTAAKPDIYYIVLDRYASSDVLTKQFGYDNSDFINYLTTNGFYNHADAHNNYPYTTMSIASTMAAGYQTDLIKQFSGAASQTVVPYHETIQNSPVVNYLKQIGYSYYHLGSWYDASNRTAQADHEYQIDGQLELLGHQYTLDDFPKVQLTNSVFWRFVQAGINLGHFPVVNYSQQSGLDMSLYQLKTLGQLASQPAGGRLIFAHILVPHDPYYFNADGSLSNNSSSDNVGAPIKQKYLGQVQFINSQLKPILDKINAQSNGQAVVVLQSDEGPYPLQLNDETFNDSTLDDEINNADMRQWSDADLQMKLGNLGAYHIPAASAADLAVAGDSVNIFRLILDRYFNANLAFLPRCYYVYPNGRAQPFVYTDITKRLTGSPSPGCSSSP